MKQFILMATLLSANAAFAQNIYAHHGDLRIYMAGEVKEGSVKFNQVRKEITLKVSSERAVIELNQLEVRSDETVHIIQPSSNSLTILRLPVQPQFAPSVRINRLWLGGKLKSNGRLVIIAPQGIYISSDGRLEASSIMLTTADMKESDWQSEEFRFEDVLYYWGKIENDGTITTNGMGAITFAGDRMSNEGSILAENSAVAMVTAAAFTYSLKNQSIVPESIRTVSKKQNLINGFTKATVIYNDTDGKIVAKNINIHVNIDNDDGQTPVQLGGTVEGNLNVNSKAKGWLWIDGNVTSRDGDVNIFSSDDIWFADRAKVLAKNITVKAADEIRCKDTDGSGKFVSLDVSSDKGDAGNILLEARRMTLAGRMLAVGKDNGGTITIVSDTEVIKNNLKTDVSAKNGKPGMVILKRR